MTTDAQRIAQKYNWTIRRLKGMMAPLVISLNFHGEKLNYYPSGKAYELELEIRILQGELKEELERLRAFEIARSKAQVQAFKSRSEGVPK